MSTEVIGSSSLSQQSPLDDRGLIKRESENVFIISKGYVPDMKVDAKFYATESLFQHLQNESRSSSSGFTSAFKQLANVATLPGIIGCSLGMPDLHSGYGFAIGNIAAMDMSKPEAVVSPGGVGFDINCGVRLLRSNLTESEIHEKRRELASALLAAIPAGVGSSSHHGKVDHPTLHQVLQDGMEWCLREGKSWPEDLLVTEEGGKFQNANPEDVSKRAKGRGREQIGTLGSGNHYLEVQVIDEVYDEEAARIMGLQQGGICIMVHTGSRGLGHQVCSDALSVCEKYIADHGEQLADRQLACVPIASPEGQKYLSAMACAANFAFCNRSLIAHDVREVFETIFEKSARDLDMHLVYDVAHNVAKIEDHLVNGEQKQVLVHRKGATRAFGPHHPSIPEKYKTIGQPVLIGGSMGTCSYVLIGTDEAMQGSFGSTCHGAGRRMGRREATRKLDSTKVLGNLRDQGVEVRVVTEKLAAEEAPETYKDVCEVVDCCHAVGISKKCVKLKPLIVIKG
eukprot:g1936.t1